MNVYQQIRQDMGRCREEAAIRPVASELELQAAFYRGDLGVKWTGTENEQVELIHPGRWNREPGPDFCGARLRINGEEISGDIEIDLRDGDWEAHGHGENPTFSQVALHGFFHTGQRRFYTRDCRHRAVPQVLLSPAQSPVAVPWREAAYEPLEEESALRLIEAAGRYRLHQKRQAFQVAARLCGEEDAFLQSLATGLGYKNNKTSFLLVAQRAGLDRAGKKDGEALLFGLAGFLQAEYFDRGDEEDKAYLRPLWEEWWTMRGREERLVVPDRLWNFAAIRPSNHPHRRLGALAVLVQNFSRVLAILREGNRSQFSEFLTGLTHPYWNRRWNLDSDALSRATALLGADRALDLTINAFVPALPSFEESLRHWAQMKGPAPSRKIREAGEWLCRATKRFSSAFHQQGLLQLHDDFFPESPAKILENYHHHSTEGRLS